MWSKNEAIRAASHEPGYLQWSRTQSCLYIEMNACFELNLQVVLCPHFSRQQFRGAALFRHKHAGSSEEEFTSGNSSSKFTMAEESTDEPVQFPSSSRRIGLSQGFTYFIEWMTHFALCCLTTKTNSLNARVWNNHIVNMNHFRWKAQPDIFYSFLCAVLCSSHSQSQHAVTIQTD